MSAPVGDTGQSAGTTAPSGPDSSTGTTDSTGTGAPSGNPATATDTTVSRADFERIQNQLRAADQRRDAAEKEAQKLKDAQLSEADRQLKALKDTEAKNAELESALKDLRIQNAFLTDNSHEWHDSKAALKLADLSGVEIDDAGTVKGLKEALDAVAKSSPYLLKPKADAGGTESSSSGTGSASGTGVTGVAGGGTGQNAVDKSALAKRFPALNGRVSS